MSTFEIQINRFLKPSFEGFLFNDAANFHRQSQLSQKSFCFQYCDKHKHDVIAQSAWYINDGVASSPFKAPFGGFEFADEVGAVKMHSFLKEVEKILIEEHVSKIHLISYPQCYQFAQAHSLHEVLLSSGYRVDVAELNQYIPIVRDNQLPDQFHASEVRRLRKCKEKGFEFKIIDHPDYEEIFSLIKMAREFKGHPVTITLDALKSILTNAPDSYMVFGVYDGEKLISVSIGVKINTKILYYYLPADDPEYINFSPSVLMIEGIYDYCVANQYQIFDLGISSVNGIRNEGLIRFKKNIGALESYKHSYSKDID